jgi:hypothetical protein
VYSKYIITFSTAKCVYRRYVLHYKQAPHYCKVIMMFTISTHRGTYIANSYLQKKPITSNDWQDCLRQDLMTSAMETCFEKRTNGFIVTDATNSFTN